MVETCNILDWVFADYLSKKVILGIFEQFIAPNGDWSTSMVILFSLV